MSQSEPDSREMRLDEALAEYLQRIDGSEIPDRESFLQQHSEVREQLDELLNAADWIEELAGPTISDLAGLGDDDKPADDETIPFRSQVDFSGLQGLDEDLDSKLDFLTAPEKAETAPNQLSQPLLPCEFGDYILERMLGRGGMGVVYYGRQKSLDRAVAVKMIRSGALASADEVQRFYDEAKSAAKLSHPNIVTVYQCGEHHGHHFFSMDYVAGNDLSAMIKEGPLDPKVAARYVKDVATAIQFAHDNKIVHRDLKPANVLVDENDQVRITDFGLAKVIDHDAGLTASGAALGTPSYMSPEQAAGRVLEQSTSTDIYALGAILFTSLTGRPPFKADTAVQTIMHVIHRPAPRVRGSAEHLDEDIETIVDVCLQKSPERRYPSAQALADDLDRYLRGVPIAARPTSAARRVWYWLLGVPVFAALLDHRLHEPTDAHRWVQRGFVTCGLMLLCAAIMMLIPADAWKTDRMPTEVQVSSGAPGGDYEEIAGTICGLLKDKFGCEASAMETEGSGDNADRLLKGDVDLALLQADSIASPKVAVLTPLYYEAVHVVVRKELIPEKNQLLKGLKVVVGSEKAGSRSVARMLLSHFGLSMSDIEILDADWHSLLDQPLADAAIIVAKLGSPKVRALLAVGEYRLVAIPDASGLALEEPTLKHVNVRPNIYPDTGLTEDGIATVATTAFLATRTDASNKLVSSLLKELFDPDVVEQSGIFSAEKAAHWRGLAWHPAAREFFLPYRGKVLN